MHNPMSNVRSRRPRKAPVPVRYPSRSKLPFPHSGSNVPSPTNADIMKAIGEVKANQQQILDDLNKMKAHISFLDATCYNIFWNTAGIFDDQERFFEYDKFHQLPPL
jgi:hypothetical protein